jgi:hypothetical protein
MGYTGITVEQALIKIAGSPLAVSKMDALEYLEVELSLDMPSMAVFALRDEIYTGREVTQWANQGVASIGDELEVQFGNNSNSLVTVFKGEVVALEPEFREDGSSVMVVRGYDKMHRMLRGTSASAHAEKNPHEVAQDLFVSGLTAQTDNTSFGVMEHQMVDNQSDLAFVQQVARANGMMVSVDETGKIKLVNRPTTPKLDAVEWGFNLIEFRPRVSVAGQVDKVEVIGWDPAQQVQVRGTKTSSSVQPKLGIVSNASGGAHASSKLAAATYLEVRRPVTTTAQANAVAQAILDEINSGFIEVEGRCAGNPAIKAATTMPVKNTGGFDGDYFITTARHVYGRGTLLRRVYRDRPAPSNGLRDDRRGQGALGGHGSLVRRLSRGGDSDQ